MSASSEAGPTLTVHGMAQGGYLWAQGPRGVDEALAPNWIMASVDGGSAFRWSARFMGSLEPLHGATGYPLLLQTGETADGANPLRDRQHPHDAFMEASFTVSGEAEVFDWEVYAALVGAPALGPTAFMHRPVSRAIPTAPIAHHFLDATHISHGVLSTSLVLEDRVRLRASAFNGHEPDEDRWDIQAPSLNSFALGMGFDATESLAVDLTFGWLDSPEQLHPGIDVRRLTLEVAHERSTRHGEFQLLGAIGRNQRPLVFLSVAEARRTLSAPIFEHYTVAGGVSTLPPGVSEEDVFIEFPSRVQVALLLEATLNTPSRALAVRLERAEKDELFDPADARHATIYPVSKIEVGASQQLFQVGSFRVDVGGTGAVHNVGSDLSDAYGSARPLSATVYGGIRFGGGHH